MHDFKEHDVVRMKEAYGNIPEGEEGTVVHVYGFPAPVVTVEFPFDGDPGRGNLVGDIPVFKLGRAT